MGQRLAIAVVAFFTGLASALFFLPFWVKPFLTAVENGNPSDWIGFAGNFAAGIMTLIAAAAALVAASIAIRPVYDQLREMVRQSEFAGFGILRKRAEDLNSERVLIYRVVSGAELISRHVDAFISNPLIPETGEIAVAIDRFEGSVADLQNNAGNVWGIESVQVIRTAFLDSALTAASNILKINNTVPQHHPQRRAAFTSNRPVWTTLFNIVAKQGTALHSSIEINAADAAKQLATIERRIFAPR
jgi:zinc transporter ZupT